MQSLNFQLFSLFLNRRPQETVLCWAFPQIYSAINLLSHTARKLYLENVSPFIFRAVASRKLNQ